MEETPKKPAPGKSDFAKLIEVMESNNQSTTKIEVDGSNTRRHLLEMKNMQKVMNDFQARTVFGFENFQDIVDSQKLQGMEDNKETMSIFEEIRDELKKLPKETGAADKKDEKSGGMGMMGGKIAGILAGVGAAALGIGVGVAAVISQVPKLITAFENADMEKIKKNMMVLTTMEDELGGKAEMMKEGGALLIYLTGLGLGLAVFATGSSFAVAVDKFSDEGWPQRIVDNVETLLGIAELNTEDTGKVFKALTAIGVGLGAFGIGSFFAKASDAEDAETVKQAVATYLSIANLPDASEENAELVGDTLIELGKGLTAFGVGSFFANAASNESAIQVRDSVETLLQINGIEGANPAEGKKVSATLKSLKSGLVAFGVGSFFAKAVGENMGANVKSQVIDLLSMGKEIDPKDTTVATEALNNLGKGLNKFAQGSFATSVGDFYGGILDFFSGSEGPVQQAITVGENAEQIAKGADAFQSFVDSVESLSSLGKVDFDIQDLTKKLVNYTREYSKIMEGGTIYMGSNFKTKGLAAMQADLESHVASITKLRGALELNTSTVSMSTPGPIEGMTVNTLSVENAILKMAETASGGQTNIAQRGGDTVKGGDTILITNSPAQVTDSLQVDR